MAIIEMTDGSYANVSSAYVVLSRDPSQPHKLVDERGRLVRVFERRSGPFFFASDNNIHVITVH